MTTELATTELARAFSVSGSSDGAPVEVHGETPDLLAAFQPSEPPFLMAHPDPSVIEDLIDWAINRAPSDVDRIREDAWRRN